MPAPVGASRTDLDSERSRLPQLVEPRGPTATRLSAGADQGQGSRSLDFPSKSNREGRRQPGSSRSESNRSRLGTISTSPASRTERADVTWGYFSLTLRGREAMPAPVGLGAISTSPASRTERADVTRGYFSLTLRCREEMPAPVGASRTDLDSERSRLPQLVEPRGPTSPGAISRPLTRFLIARFFAQGGGGNRSRSDRAASLAGNPREKPRKNRLTAKRPRSDACSCQAR